MNLNHVKQIENKVKEGDLVEEKVFSSKVMVMGLIRRPLFHCVGLCNKDGLVIGIFFENNSVFT